MRSKCFLLRLYQNYPLSSIIINQLQYTPSPISYDLHTCSEWITYVPTVHVLVTAHPFGHLNSGLSSWYCFWLAPRPTYCSEPLFSSRTSQCSSKVCWFPHYGHSLFLLFLFVSAFFLTSCFLLGSSDVRMECHVYEVEWEHLVIIGIFVNRLYRLRVQN